MIPVEGRKIDNLIVEADTKTLKNLTVVRSPRLKDFLVLHSEKKSNELKNKDFIDFCQSAFDKLVSSSSIEKIGRTNKILRSTNVSTPKYIRKTIRDRRNELTSMVFQHQIDNCQRTNKSPLGICLGFSFQKNEFELFLNDYVQKHQTFMSHVTNLTVCGDEGN